MRGLIGKLTNRILLLSLVTTFSPGTSYADDIFKALRGPTNWQIDENIIYSTNENNVGTLTNKLILKYWDGDQFGKWGFISLPYESIGFHKGLGNISIGSGPWGKIGNVGVFLYGALTFPKGNRKVIDKKVGILSTYITPDKKYELDAIVQYTWTGKNKKDVNPPNAFYAGLIAGGKINNNIRAALGMTSLVRGNDYLINLRSVSRYTFSKKWHIEFVVDKGLNSNHIPKKKYQVSLQIRHNF